MEENNLLQKNILTLHISDDNDDHLIKKFLNREGFHTIGDLVELNSTDLKKINHIGNKSSAEIITSIHSLGLTFADESSLKDDLEPLTLNNSTSEEDVLKELKQKKELLELIKDKTDQITILTGQVHNLKSQVTEIERNLAIKQMTIKKLEKTKPKD
jgi:uncharacterized protein (UPF0216 family)